MKKPLAAMTALFLLCRVCALPLPPVSAEIIPEHISCITDDGTNVNGHDYPTWASPVYSHLVPLPDGTWMRVQPHWYQYDQVNVEYYDPEFHLTKRICVPKQMQDFGAFYAASDGNYYLVTGDSAASKAGESPKFDIAKYSPEWKLLAHVQTAGSDVAAAFEAGTVRCTDDGKRLLIHTARKMSSGHQSSYVIELNMQDMKITYDSGDKGYTSHSFNQFVMLDGNDTVLLDQGDCYPRAVVLNRYSSAGRSGSVNLIEYGPTGDADLSNMMVLNYTGAAVGAFEQSSTHYLAAYNTINPDNWYDLAANSDYLFSETARNIRIAAVPKDNLKAEHITDTAVTDYADDDTTAGNPYLIPVGEDRFLLMWAHGKTVCYTFTDGTGALSGKQYTMDAQLSDCNPVVSGGKVYWYTWNQSDIRFYSIDLNDPAQTETFRRTAGHEFETAKPDAAGNVYDVCFKCGLRILHDAPPDYIAGIHMVSKSDDRIESYEFHTDSDVLDAGNQFEVYIDKINTTEDTFTADIKQGSDYLEYDFHSRLYTVKDFNAPSVIIEMNVQPWDDIFANHPIRFTARHDYIIQQITAPDAKHSGSIQVQCAGCGHVSTFDMNSLLALNGGDIIIHVSDLTVQIIANFTQNRTIQLTMTDPETGAETALEEGTDFFVGFARDAVTNDEYTIIAAAENSELIAGSMVIKSQSTAQNTASDTAQAAGDINGDGKLTKKDAELLRQWLSGETKTKLSDWEAGDLNHDGHLDAADLTLLKRLIRK